MDRKSCRRLNTVSFIIILLGYLEIVDCANNLQLVGYTVNGGTFQLVCSSTPDIDGTAAYIFYRGKSSANTFICSIGYTQHRCTNITESPYPYGCEDNGSKAYINITVPTYNLYNLTEHNKYWRCSTLSDPTAAHNNEVHVNIIVPIAGISFISPPVSPDNTVTVVSDVPTTFQCQTTQGRPEANITWYLDNARLSGGTTTTTPVSGDIVNTTGSLILTVNRTADDKVLSCRATNYVNMEPVESSVKPIIRVRYGPPGPPIISGYYNGTVYKTRVGRPQSLMCQVPTAYPVPTLSWSCLSYTLTGTTPLPGSTDVVSSSIAWTATSTEPGQTCQCTSYQEVSGTVSTYINIDVLYPPSSPTYNLYMSSLSTDVSGSIDVIQGDTVHLICTTVSNPPLTTDQYKWTRSTGGSWTHGQQDLTIPNIDRSSDDTYTCEVTNIMTTTDGTSDTGRNTSHISVHVLYPPFSPTYTLDVSGVPTDGSGSIDVIQGDTMRLTCSTVSNPHPATDQYRWTRSTEGSHGQQELTMTHINLSDDDVYMCEVSNTMTPTLGGTRTGTNQSVIAVNVLYPPSAPHITYRCKTNPVSISVTHKTSYPVTCQSDGNPVPSVHWTGREQTTDNGTVYVYNIQSSGNYTCTVNNTMRRMPGDPSTVSKSMTIEVQVLYGPEVSLIQSQYIVEGSPLHVTCTAHSNPPVTSYYWSRPESTDRDTEGYVLHIPSVRRFDAGVYTCHVANVMLPTCEQHISTGTGSRGTMVEVQYLPDIMGHADRDVVEHQTSTTSCTADGIPATYTFYNWRHVAPDNVTVLRSIPGTNNSTTTTLTLSDVNYQDTGYYLCSVSNGVRHYITGETTATTDVVFTVKNGPVTESLKAATGRKNGSSTLTVTFYSNDGTLPTVAWRKSSKQTVSNITDIRFESSVNVSNITLTMYGHSIPDQPGFIGCLTVHNITQEDFTNYSCQMSNTVGSTTVFLALKPEGPPDPPRQLRTTLTDSSITLLWLSGYHGGADQTFTVEYRTTKETVFKVAAVISGGQKEGVQFNTTIHELSHGTEYVIQITCSNRFGKQKEIRFIQARTAPVTETDIPPVSTSSIGPSVGGTIGGLLGVVLVGLIVYLLKRRVLDKSSNTTMRNTEPDGNRVYDTLQIHSPEASPYQTIELNDSSSSGVYVNLEL